MSKIFLAIADKMSLSTILFIAAGATIVGDIFAKYWSLGRRPAILWLALFAYLLGSAFYIPSLIKEGLVVTSTIWSLLSTLGFIVVGLLLFREHLSVPQAIAVGLGVVSLIIFAVAEK